MACAVVRTPEFTAIVCGLPAPRRCHFCHGKGLYLCDWKVERYVSVAAYLIQVGDFLKPIDRNMQRRVVFVQKDSLYVYLGIDVEGKGILQTKVPRDGKFSVLKPGTCDLPCCDNCAREVGEDRHYCQDHWNAWRDVA